ncbi:hypothetical protein ACJ3XI_11350 [Litorimonas sp. RW-G-Af-16]|uniref:hypothetical protein n=1 Tax=Litorimonas sp. RW-G-Af-16 TaxID=3241168 RepID=UPI00390CACE9
MTRKSTLAITPSLELAFAPERSKLVQALEGQMSAAETVGAARLALDRAGVRFAKEVTDPQLQKAGIWLLEMIKSGAGVLDRATQAEIIYTENASVKSKLSHLRPTLFYGAAGALALAGFVQGSGLAMLSAGVLALIHTLDPRRLKSLQARLPFAPKPKAIEDQSGRRFIAEAQIFTDAHGFVGQLSDALKTADHILLRLAAPTDTTHWSDDTRLTGLLQNLLEAAQMDDQDFAMQVIDKELPSLLSQNGVELIHYSAKTRHMFDTLPAMGEGAKTEMAAPAIVNAEGRILKRGRVWVRT